jgi:hypothetical protein
MGTAYSNNTKAATQVEPKVAPKDRLSHNIKHDYSKYVVFRESPEQFYQRMYYNYEKYRNIFRG